MSAYWTTVAEWSPLRDGWQSSPTERSHPDQAAASLEGKQFACMSGVTKVRVLDPDGFVAECYDRTDNLWRICNPPAPVGSGQEPE